MADRYRTFEFNSYQNPPTTTGCVQGQHYMRNSGPCAEGYDPTRSVETLRTPTYNTTANSSLTNGFHQNGTNGATHQTFLAAGGGIMNVSAPRNGLELQGLADFDPFGIPERLRQQLGPTLQQAGFTADVIESELRRRGQQFVGSSVMPDPFSQGSSNFIKPAAIESRPPQPPPVETWLVEIEVKVPGLSLEPMHGPELLKRVEQRTGEVVARYLPCVDFLVSCQQELRRGLAAATQKKLVHRSYRDAMTPRQFYNSYISDLPRRFGRKHQRYMKGDDLNAAMKELQKLCGNAKAVEHQGCEAVKNTFLGGMKDGESWGLRKWLSKHGGALHICNDCEQILNACQKLDRSKDSTRKLSSKLRPLAKKVLTRLKSDVPASYQEQSTAHPYLPFFHRLESCLRGMSTFDPEDDDVICIDDDDEVEEIKSKPPPPPRPKKSRKRKAASSAANTGASSRAAKRPAVAAAARPATATRKKDVGMVDLLDGHSTSPETSPAAGDAVAAAAAAPPASDISDLGDGASVSAGVSGANSDTDDARYMQELLKAFDEDANNDDVFAGLAFDDDNMLGGSAGSSYDAASRSADARDSLDLASDIERLATLFDQNQHVIIRPESFIETSFWDDGTKYAAALRIFSEILRTPETVAHLDPVDEQALVDRGQPVYSSVIKNPLCFRDIVCALIANGSNEHQIAGNGGALPYQSLSTWNMWKGMDLLQAIDLVFLNSLAYGKAAEEGRSASRSNANKLRKLFWAGVKRVLDSGYGPNDVERRRKNTPTRRGESSGFVVHKTR